MKSYIYIISLLVHLTIFNACTDSDAPADQIDDTTIIRMVEDYTDPRDGHVYHCVQIGDQIWMAENLAYFLEKGTYDGCYTWNEETIDLENIKLDISLWCELCKQILHDPQYDWDALGYNTSLIESQIQFAPIFGDYEPYHDTWKNDAPEFYNVVILEVDKAKIEHIGPVAQKHMEDMETKNGGYSQTYGFLYSLDAARKAVPEGWRLPDDNDWKKLESALGMASTELDKINAWRGVNAGDHLKEGGLSLFNAQMGGCLAYERSSTDLLYIRLKDCGYFWSNEETTKIDETTDESSESGEQEGEQTEIFREGIIRQIAIYSSQIWRGTTRLDNGYHPTAYSVRCVKDIK